MIRAVPILALLAISCGPRARWMGDESARIDHAMACEPWQSHSPEAEGITLVGAPALAPPWKPGEGYSIGRENKSGRKLRLGKADRSPPRARRSRQDH